MVNWFKNLFKAKGYPDLSYKQEQTVNTEEIPIGKDGKKPWAKFEITDVSEDRFLRIEFDWNESFILFLKEQGYSAESDEEMVELFFQSTHMAPDNGVEEPNQDILDFYANKRNAFYIDNDEIKNGK
jgi:hypothetical protein